MIPWQGHRLRQQRRPKHSRRLKRKQQRRQKQRLLRTLADAAVMQNIQHIAALIGVIGCGIGWLVSFILLLIKGAGAMNWIFATVYPAVWMALSAAIGVWQARKAMK